MRRWNRQIVIVLALLLGVSGTAHADLEQSTSYSMNESELGAASSDFTSHSANYSNVPGTDDSGSTLGDNFVGNSSSASYQSNSGFDTTAQPGLTMTINTGSVDLGALSVGAKSTTTATFSVKDYTSYGYAVQVIGSVPTYGSHPLTALTTDTASSAGTEQFGINLVNNNVSGVGADPVQVPSGSFSFGVAGNGVTGTYGTTRPYTIPEKWRYVSGETVASSPKTSGETDYTITLMANISTATPGGKYTGALDIVATGTY